MGADESATMDSDERPRIFDWIALREVERYVESTAEAPRICARLVMSDQAAETKLDNRNLKTLSNLEQRGALEVERIRREEYTGGRYRQLEVGLADAMLAVGGGKGAYICGTDMLEAGKPVLPLDLKIGASTEDGEGAVRLLRELMQEPGRFFPRTGAAPHRQDRYLIIESGRFTNRQSSPKGPQNYCPWNWNRANRCNGRESGKFFSPVDKVVGKFVTWVGLIRAIDFLKGL